MIRPRILVLMLLVFACDGGDDDTSGDGGTSDSGGAGLPAGSSGVAGQGGSAAAMGGSGGDAGTSALAGCVLQDGPSFDALSLPELVYTSTSVGGPNDMVVRGKTLYLWTGDAVLRVALDTFGSELVARFPIGMSRGALAMNDTHAFVVVEDQVMSAPLNAIDATPEVVLSDVQTGIEYIAGVDAQNVYVANSHTGVLRAVPVEGGAAEEIYNDSNAGHLWVTDGFVYAYQDAAFAGKLTRVALGGGTPELVVEASGVTSFAFSSDAQLYFGGDGGLYRTTLGTTRDSTTPRELLMRSPNGFPFIAEIVGITLFADRAYWISDAPSVGWVDLSGSTCTETLRLRNPFETIVVSADYVYFTYESDVYRMPRE